MKQNLTVEQSSRLIELGADESKASSKYVGRWEHYSTGTFADPDSIEPIFTLADILSLLPKEINDGTNGLDMYFDGDFDSWITSYSGYHKEEAPELIDALYELLVWVLKNHKDQVKL